MWDGPLQCPFQFTTVLTTLSPPIGVLTYCTCVLLKNEIVHLPLAPPEVRTLKNRVRGVVFFKKKKMRVSLFFYGRKKWYVCGMAALPLLVPTPGGMPVYNSRGTPWFARIQQLKWNRGKCPFLCYFDLLYVNRVCFWKSSSSCKPHHDIQTSYTFFHHPVSWHFYTCKNPCMQSVFTWYSFYAIQAWQSWETRGPWDARTLYAQEARFPCSESTCTLFINLHWVCRKDGCFPTTQGLIKLKIWGGMKIIKDVVHVNKKSFI